MGFNLLDLFGLRDRPPRERRHVTEQSARPGRTTVRPAAATGHGAGNAGGKTVALQSGRPIRRRPRVSARPPSGGKRIAKRPSRTTPRRPKAGTAGKRGARTSRAHGK